MASIPHVWPHTHFRYGGKKVLVRLREFTPGGMLRKDTTTHARVHNGPDRNGRDVERAADQRWSSVRPSIDIGIPARVE